MSEIALILDEGVRRRLVPICGAVAAGFGISALLGWALGHTFLASFGPGLIPMAPSTALLFAVYGIAALLRTRQSMGRRAHRASVAINSAGALVALLLLILSLLGIHPDIEHFGSALTGTVGGVPVGHMSPLTALGFLLASLSFFGSLPSSSHRPWSVTAARWIAAVLLGMSLVLVLSYLVGCPLFYGHGWSLIPPAAPTGIAFAFLGTALLTLAGWQASTRPPERISYQLATVLVLIAAGIVISGGLYLRTDGRRYRAEVEHQLSAAAELKMNELTQWRFERLGDAVVFLGNTSFSGLVRRVFDKPQDPQAHTQLQAWLTKVQTYYQYNELSVLDARGAERLAVPEGRTPVSSVIALRVPEVIRANEVVFQDFYRNEHDQRVYLSVLVPIFDERGQALGMLVLRIDPETYLYPLLHCWPTLSPTAETQLVRREGNDVLFVNELRFQKHTALTLRIPLAEKEVAAVKAVLGQKGIVEARDYREVPVLAALRAVPGSPWFLVARLDAAEVNAPLRERLLVIVLLMVGMLSVTAAGMRVFWQAQRVRHFRKLHKVEQERAILIDSVTDYAIFMLDPSGRVVSWNAGAGRLKGYRTDEIVGQHFSRFHTAEDVAGGKPANALETATREGRFEDEGRRVRKDGSLFWANVVITALHDQTGQLLGFAKVTRDITERKQAEQALREGEERFRRLVEHIHDALVTDDDAGKITFANDQFLALFGFEREQLPHLQLDDYVAPEWREQLRGRHDRSMRGETVPARFEYEGVRQDGRRLWLEVDVVPLKDGTGRVMGTQSAIRDVTERMQAKKAMSETLRFTQQILDTSPIGIITYKVSGEAVAANSTSAQLIGGSLGQVKAQNFRHIESWRQSGLLALAEEALASGEARRGEFHLTTTLGKEIWVEARFAPFSYGDEPHLLALFEDIYARKHAEQQLLHKKQELEAIFQSLPDLYFRLRRDGTILDYLSGDRRKLYVPPEQFLGKKIQTVLPAEVESQFEDALREFDQSQTTVAFEYELPADGQKAVFEARLSRLHDDEVIALVRDITERKGTEEALRHAEEKYRRIFEEAVVGIFQTTPDGRYLAVNPELARLYGFDSPAELMASRTDIAHQSYVDPSERKRFKRRIEETGIVRDFQFQAYRKDGSKLWWRENARAVRDASGAVLYYEGTVEDITERRTLEEQLRLAQRLEAVGRLAGGVAHDFNNVLGVIVGYSQMLEEAHAWTETQDRQVKEIRKAADRATGITRQLLAFSRKQILQPKALNLNALIADLIKLLRRLIGEDVELITNGHSDLGQINADPGQIEQIIMNLAINSRDAMPQGGKLVIETANVDLDHNYAAVHPPVVPGPYVMLAMSDTGCGMGAETQARIFEPFFTTKELGKGTGLGLSIVYGIVKQSNGYIWVYSEPGRGTTFKIYLPRVDESPETVAPGRSKASLPRGTETILLAEDEQAMRTMARLFLESNGYAILEARSGQEAMGIAQQHSGQIHLLLTDVIMPGMSGRELAETLAASRADTKVLYMSGYTDEHIAQQGILNPGLQLLEKPFTKESLLGRVRDVLDAES